MNSSYLKYQLDYNGMKDFRIFRHRSYELESWEIYEDPQSLKENILYLADYSRLASCQEIEDAYFWCIYNCPPKAELLGLDGFYIGREYSFPQLLKLIQKIFGDYDKWNFALRYPGDIGLENLLSISTDILHMPMTIVDNNFQYMAQNSWYASIMQEADGEHPDMDSVIWTKQFRECTFRKGVFHFYLEEEKKELLFERLSKCLVEIFENQKELVGHVLQDREFSHAVKMLLEGKKLQDDSALRRNKWLLTNEYQIVAFQFFQYFPMEEGEQYLFRRLRLVFPESCVIKKSQDFICIRNLNTSKYYEDEFREKMAVFLREHVAKAGISNPFPGTENFSEYLWQAYDALRIGERTDPHFWYYYFKQYTFEYLLDQCTLYYSAKEVVMPELFILKQSDSDNGTDLFQTLDIYLQNGCSDTKSAQKLYIHRTSLLKRISKIEDLTGLQIKDPDTQLYLMLSYKLLKRAR